MEISHLHKYSDPLLCLSTFGSDYSLESSWVWRYKLGTPVFGEFHPFFSADPLKLCQVGWGASVHSYFKVSPEMFKSGLWLGHSKTFRNLSRSHSCVVLASFPQSWVVSQSLLLKTSPHHDATTTRLPPDVTLGIQAKEVNLGFIKPENHVLHGLRDPLGAFWQTPNGLSCAFYWGVASVCLLYQSINQMYL